jgi:hypothetical protein
MLCYFRIFLFLNGCKGKLFFLTNKQSSGFFLRQIIICYYLGRENVILLRNSRVFRISVQGGEGGKDKERDRRAFFPGHAPCDIWSSPMREEGFG